MSLLSSHSVRRGPYRTTSVWDIFLVSVSWQLAAATAAGTDRVIAITPFHRQLVKCETRILHVCQTFITCKIPRLVGRLGLGKRFSVRVFKFLL